MEMLMSSLGRSGFDVIAIMPPPKLPGWHRPGVRVVPLKTPGEFHTGMGLRRTMGNIVARLTNSARLFFYLFRERPCVCVAHEPDSWAIAVLGKLVLRYRLVEEMNEIFEDRIAFLPAPLQRIAIPTLKHGLALLARASDCIIHVSKERYQYHVGLRAPVTIIHHYPNLPAYSGDRTATTSLPPGRFVMIHAGPLRPASAPKSLLDALLMTRQAVPELLLVVLGGVSGQVDSYQDQMDELLATGHLKFLPRLERDEVIRHLRAAHLGICLFAPVCLSAKVASPMKLFEYLAAGVAVLGSRTAGIEDIIAHWKCGKVVDAQDAKGIAEAIVALARDRRELEIMAWNARRAAEDSFNWRLEEPKLLKLFSGLCCHQCGTRRDDSSAIPAST